MTNGDPFQEASYNDLRMQFSEDRFLDLASVLQAALLKIRTDKHGNIRPLYHLAGFSL